MKKEKLNNKSMGAAPKNKAHAPLPEINDDSKKRQISAYLSEDDIAWLNSEADKHFRSGVSGQLSYIIHQARHDNI